MKSKLFFLILIILCCNSSIFCQVTSADSLSGIKDFNSIKLVTGVPNSLKSNPYFKNSEIISFTKIYCSNNDTIYFVCKKLDSESLNLVLLNISDNNITSFNYLDYSIPDSERLFSQGNIKLYSGKISYIDMFYLPKYDSLLYRFVKNSNEKPTAFSYFEKNYGANFEIGLRYEFSYLSSKILNANHNYFGYYLLPIPLFNMHVTAGLRIFKDYKIDFRFGIKSIYEDFIGLEDGIFFQANLFNSDFFGAFGADFFHNGGASHGVSDYSKSGGEITFYSIGVGYQASKHFNLDLTYYIPDNKSYGHDTISYPYHRYDKMVNSLINLGCQYSFIL